MWLLILVTIFCEQRLVFYVFIYIYNMTFDFSYLLFFVNNMTFLFIFVTQYTYLDMFVINNTVFSINLSTLIKRALFTYKPVVPNCMYNRIITQEPNFKSGNIPRPWAIENLWSLPNFSSTRAVLKLFSTQLFTLFKDHSKTFLCFFS